MNRATVVTLALACALAGASLWPGSGIYGGGLLIEEAHAVVGRPATPVSVAGVARRTTRRTIAMTSVYVATLPPACTVVVIEGVSLHQCGSTYYQASGTQYVVVTVN